MKIKKGFVLRELAGEMIITGEGFEHIDFNKIITVNTTAAYIWENINNKEFDKTYIIDLLTSRYNVEKAVAEKDTDALLSSWKEIGLIEE